MTHIFLNDVRPEVFGDAFAQRPYDAGIAFADLQIQRLVDFLKSHKLSKRTLIVVVGDHGEGLMEHEEAQHGSKLYNSTLHVPLIIAGPSFIKPGTRGTTLRFGNVDVVPTILSSLGIDPGTGAPPGNAAAGGSCRTTNRYTSFPYRVTIVVRRRPRTGLDRAGR